MDSEDRLAMLKKQIEREQEAAQKELERRRARQSASLLGEIQEVIAAVARAKGFDFVVSTKAGPEPDADELQVNAVWKHSVLYANPRNDITEEVIRELNRRYEAAGDKGK
jgi:Skp family chaperone for outer membrane proteins